MAKKLTRGRGRPAVNNPKRNILTFKIDDSVKAAILAYRDGLGVEGLSIQEAARDLLIKCLRERGLLK